LHLKLLLVQRLRPHYHLHMAKSREDRFVQLAARSSGMSAHALAAACGYTPTYGRRLVRRLRERIEAERADLEARERAEQAAFNRSLFRRLLEDSKPRPRPVMPEPVKAPPPTPEQQRIMDANRADRAPAGAVDRLRRLRPRRCRACGVVMPCGGGCGDMVRASDGVWREYPRAYRTEVIDDGYDPFS
jgi:hypothetical protein